MAALLLAIAGAVLIGLLAIYVVTSWIVLLEATITTFKQRAMH